MINNINATTGSAKLFFINAGYVAKANSDVYNRFIVANILKHNGGAYLNINVIDITNEGMQIKENRIYYDTEANSFEISDIMNNILNEKIIGVFADRMMRKIVYYFMRNDGLELLFPELYDKLPINDNYSYIINYKDFNFSYSPVSSLINDLLSDLFVNNS
jgi:hypothetical protein